MEFRLTFMVEKVSYLTQINKAQYTQHHQLGEYVFVSDSLTSCKHTALNETACSQILT